MFRQSGDESMTIKHRSTQELNTATTNTRILEATPASGLHDMRELSFIQEGRERRRELCEQHLLFCLGICLNEKGINSHGGSDYQVETEIHRHVDSRTHINEAR